MSQKKEREFVQIWMLLREYVCVCVPERGSLTMVESEREEGDGETAAGGPENE